MILRAASELRLDTNWIDYLLIFLYFGFVLGIGILARRSVSSSIDFFLSGRSLPAWVTGLAFISANLGAVEIIGHVGERRRSTASRPRTTSGSAPCRRCCSSAW